MRQVDWTGEIGEISRKLAKLVCFISWKPAGCLARKLPGQVPRGNARNFQLWNTFRDTHFQRANLFNKIKLDKITLNKHKVSFCAFIVLINNASLATADIDSEQRSFLYLYLYLQI